MVCHQPSWMTIVKVLWLSLLLLLCCSSYTANGDEVASDSSSSWAQEAYVDADGNEYLSEGGNTAAEGWIDYGDDIGVRQYMDDDRLDEIQTALQRARAYMDARSGAAAAGGGGREEFCKNNHESCAIWSVLGECERNPRFMNVTCPPMCGACDSLIVDSKCRRDPHGIDAWYPGDATRMFERILVEYATQYDIRVLSRPTLAPGDTKETATYILGPWIITLENFISNEEADRMAALGEQEGYQRTTYRTAEQESDAEFMKDLQHTASVVYCQSDLCYYDPTHQAILERMSNITSLPKTYYEFFQMIRYKEGEWFKTHNDFAPHHALKPEGVRLLTFLVYHSDVEEGGGTSFGYFNLTVNPKKGRAVIFPCVLDENPNVRDNQMDHEALKVIKGIKYAFNTHAHQRDYMTPFNSGCGT